MCGHPSDLFHDVVIALVLGCGTMHARWGKVAFPASSLFCICLFCFDTMVQFGNNLHFTSTGHSARSTWFNERLCYEYRDSSFYHSPTRILSSMISCQWRCAVRWSDPSLFTIGRRTVTMRVLTANYCSKVWTWCSQLSVGDLHKLSSLTLFEKFVV